MKTKLDIISKIKNSEGISLVKAVAGAGKTTLLVELAKELDSEGIYVAYNKSVAKEAATKFPAKITCSTIHSVAYKAVMAGTNRSIGYFNARDIKENIRYDDKVILVSDIQTFCLSKFTSFKDYGEFFNLSKKEIELGLKYLNKMASGEIPCTHDFYLKLMHMMLNHNLLDYDDLGIIMLDEAGDVNEVTLEIVKLLPAKRKVLVGDPYQNIYSFNHTINCFDVLKGEAVEYALTKSYRVSDSIASSVQSFCRKYLDEDMEFEGVPLKDTVIKTTGYLSRTNSNLVSRIIELNTANVPYKLVRKASVIFDLPLMLAGMKYQGTIKNPAYKYLQIDYDEWKESPELQKKYKSPIAYLNSKYGKDDIGLSVACNLVISLGAGKIFEAYYKAKEHESIKDPAIILATAHSVKGLEFDKVVIAEDLNISVKQAIIEVSDRKKYPTPDTYPQHVKDSFNLYYVAVTRAIKSLENARFLEC